MDTWKRRVACGLFVAAVLSTSIADDKRPLHATDMRISGKIPTAVCERAVKIAHHTVVALDVTVGTDGRVSGFKLLQPKSSALENDTAFRNAVKTIRFEPLLLNGKAIEVQTHLGVTCDL